LNFFEGQTLKAKVPTDSLRSCGLELQPHLYTVSLSAPCLCKALRHWWQFSPSWSPLTIFRLISWEQKLFSSSVWV